MGKRYTWLRVDTEAKKELDMRLNKINNVDLKNLGITNKKIHQIDLTKYLFKNRVYISDNDLKKLAKKRFGGKIC